jgi:hypothetical protein
MNQTTSPSTRSPMTVALGILTAILLGTTIHFASKSSSLAEKEQAAADAAKHAQSESDRATQAEADSKTLAETRTQLERAQADLAARGGNSAAAGGPSAFWSGKPWYGSLDLEAMMRWYRRPEKPEDVQAVEFLEAKTELQRRNAGK